MNNDLKAQIYNYARLGFGIDDIAVKIQVRGPRWRQAIKSIVWSAQREPQ